MSNNTPSTPTTYSITYSYADQRYVSISNIQESINSGETYTTIITATKPNDQRFNSSDIVVQMGDDYLVDGQPNEEYLVDISENGEDGIKYRLTIPNVNGDISIYCWAS